MAALAPHNNSDVAELLKTYSERGASPPFECVSFRQRLSCLVQKMARVTGPHAMSQ